MKKYKKRPEKSDTVLVCAPFGKDTAVLIEVLASAALNAVCCVSLNEVSDKLSSSTLLILITEEALLSPSFKAFQKVLRQQEPWSDIPIVLLASAGATPSRSTTGFLSALRDAANISILERPARVPTILSVLRSAQRARARQRQIRNLMMREEESASRLKAAHQGLEKRVRERTSELSRTNLKLSREIRERKRVENDLRKLSAKVLQIQDEERRRIARDLHDGVGQTLTAALMPLAQSLKAVLPSNCESSLREVEGLIRSSLKEIRTISYLLHPPLLDESGLMSAIRWYVDGFSQRSHISVKLDLDESKSRLSQDIETAIFRIVQEALTNVHRHSQAKNVRITIKFKEFRIGLEIEDDGKGISSEVLQVASKGRKGVGLASMRERSALLRGTFDVKSNDGGTRISVQIPLQTASTRNLQSTSNSANQ